MQKGNPFNEFREGRDEMAFLAPHRNGIRDGDYSPVGSLIYCAYWRYVYRVVAHSPNGEIVVERITDHPYTVDQWGKRVWSHRTPVDMRDLVLAMPIKRS